MIATLPKDNERILDQDGTPHLSYSRINRYLTCPEQYRLHYIEKLRPKVESAGLVFGALIHVVLADFFRAATAPVEAFRGEWENLKDIELRYNKRDSWQGLMEKGEKLMQKFLQKVAPKVQRVFSVEKKFELAIDSLNVPFIGIMDLVAQMDCQIIIVDFKTAASGYEDHEVALSDQLTAYWLANPEAYKVALCILVKTKEPRIEWHFAERNANHLTEFLDKVRLVSEDIAAREFYKRPGKHCGYCDFLPVCLGDKKRAQETLIRIT